MSLPKLARTRTPTHIQDTCLLTQFKRANSQSNLHAFQPPRQNATPASRDTAGKIRGPAPTRKWAQPTKRARTTRCFSTLGMQTQTSGNVSNTRFCGNATNQTCQGHLRAWTAAFRQFAQIEQNRVTLKQIEWKMRTARKSVTQKSLWVMWSL